MKHVDCIEIILKLYDELLDRFLHASFFGINTVYRHNHSRRDFS